MKELDLSRLWCVRRTRISHFHPIYSSSEVMCGDMTPPYTLVCVELDIENNTILFQNRGVWLNHYLTRDGYFGLGVLRFGLDRDVRPKLQNPYPFLRVIFAKKVLISKDFSRNIGLFFKFQVFAW